MLQYQSWPGGRQLDLWVQLMLLIAAQFHKHEKGRLHRFTGSSIKSQCRNCSEPKNCICTFDSIVSTLIVECLGNWFLMAARQSPTHKSVTLLSILGWNFLKSNLRPLNFHSPLLTGVQYLYLPSSCTRRVSSLSKIRNGGDHPVVDLSQSQPALGRALNCLRVPKFNVCTFHNLFGCHHTWTISSA